MTSPGSIESDTSLNEWIARSLPSARAHMPPFRLVFGCELVVGAQLRAVAATGTLVAFPVRTARMLRTLLNFVLDGCAN